VYVRRTLGSSGFALRCAFRVLRKRRKVHFESIQLGQVHAMQLFVLSPVPSLVAGVAMRTLVQDIRYGVRMLVKQPGFSLAAVLVLSIGIGGSTAMFSIVNTLLLKPLLINRADQIVGVFSRDTHKADSYRAFSYPNYTDLRANDNVFSSVM